MSEQPKMRGVFERPPGSGVWWINYYDADGVRHRERIGRQSVAIDAYIQRRTEVRDGRFVAPRSASRISFGELADERMGALKQRLAPLSYHADEIRLRRLKKELGEMPARAVTPQRVDELLRRMGEGEDARSGGTLNRYRSLISSIFAIAIHHGRIAGNPVKQVARRREAPGRIRFLSSLEEKKLRKAVRAEWPDRVPELDLALHTGMRKGEQFGLKWSEVDLERKVLTVFGKTGRRFIEVNAEAKKALLKLHKLSNGSPFVCPHKRTEQQRDWRRWFEECLETGKIADFRWHDLRHTFASRLVMSGVDLRTVQELLGHRSILTTMRYAHLSQAHRHSAVEKLASWHQDGTKPSRSRSKVLQLPIFQSAGP